MDGVQLRTRSGRAWAACAIRLGAFTSNSEARAYGLKGQEGYPLPRTRLFSLDPPVARGSPGCPWRLRSHWLHMLGSSRPSAPGVSPAMWANGWFVGRKLHSGASASQHIGGVEAQLLPGLYWELGPREARKPPTTRRRFHQLRHAVLVPAESPRQMLFPLTCCAADFTSHRLGRCIVCL